MSNNLEFNTKNTLEFIAEKLNELIKLDPYCISDLFLYKAYCVTDKFQHHPTVVIMDVGSFDAQHLRVVGLLNGLFGSPNSNYRLAMVFDSKEYKINSFTVIDLREDVLTDNQKSDA